MNEEAETIQQEEERDRLRIWVDFVFELSGFYGDNTCEAPNESVGHEMVVNLE